MADGAIRFDLLIGVLGLTSFIAACAVAVGVIAFRKNHYLIDVCEKITRRLNLLGRDEESRGGAVRVNLIVLAVLLLWISFLVCLVGLRAVLV